MSTTKKIARKRKERKKVEPISAAVIKGEADDVIVGKNLLLQSLARLGLGNKGITKILGYSEGRISYRIKKYGLVGCRAEYRSADGNTIANILPMCASLLPDSKEESKLASDVAKEVYNRMIGKAKK
jgi:hypothetical protein